VAELGAFRSLQGGTVFIEQGEASSTMFCIVSGAVQVYASEADGTRRDLNRLGVGEHLGELALVGDSVRTASAMTLCDSCLFSLSRRAFLRCLAENPQLALNLDKTLLWDTLDSDLGSESAARYRAWAAFRRSGLPLILLIGGCTGTGKSTVAAELALRLDIGRTQSTDLLREVMRLLIPERLAPELHASTFEAWRSLPYAPADQAVGGASLIEGYRTQAAKVAVAMDGVIDRSIKEGASAIIEGIHISPAYCELRSRSRAVVVPLLLTIPVPEQLKQHFQRRGQESPTRSTSRYLESFELIWRLQEYFIQEAERHGVAMIPNAELGRTIDHAMEVITTALVRQFAGSGAEEELGGRGMRAQDGWSLASA